MDLALLTEGIHQVTLGETPYTVRLLKLREWGRLQAWLKQAVPSPVAEAARALNELKIVGDTVSADVRQAILDHAHEAARLWPPRVGSIAWVQALDSVEGGTARFLSEALRAGGHDVTDDDAALLAAIADVDQVADVFRVCLHGELPLPKSMPAPMEAEPAAKWLTTSRRTTGARSSTPPNKPRAGRTPKSAS